MEDNDTDTTHEAPSFRLYVVHQDDPEQSHVADIVRNVCINVFGELGDFEIVSLADRPELAGRQAIYATPLLERLHPLPTQRFFGDLTNGERLFELLSTGARPSRASLGTDDRDGRGI